MSNELRKIILEAYLKHTEESTTTGLWYHEIAKELGLDEKKVIAECGYLEDDECIEKEKIRFSGGRVSSIGVRITSKGKEALQTIYNPEWVKQKNEEKEEAKEIEERRHRENLEVQRKANKNQWVGIIIVGIIGIAGLIITIIK